MAFISFHFFSFNKRPGTAVWAIYFTGKGSTSELESSALVQELCSRLRVYWWGHDRKSLLAMSSDDSRPRVLLGELDRIAAAFGSTDRHRVPSTKSRSAAKRLAAVGDAVLESGRWDLQAVSLFIRPQPGTSLNISTIPKLSSMIMAPLASSSARVSRARGRGYRDHSSEAARHVVLTKLQPLSLRAALAEARFLEAEISA